MVLWYKKCGALMGLREPLSDWSIDREAICRECAKTDGWLPSAGKRSPSEGDEGMLPVPATDDE